MATRDEKFNALLERAQKAKDDEQTLKKRRRKYARELRAWSATGTLSEAEKKQAQSLTRGFSTRRSTSNANAEE
jgi:proline dehydrogenase